MSSYVVQRIRTVITGIEQHLNMWTPKIQCDRCGTQYRAHGINPFDSLRDPAKVDRVIRENGWQIVDGQHICPKCQQIASGYAKLAAQEQTAEEQSLAAARRVRRDKNIRHRSQ